MTTNPQIDRSPAHRQAVNTGAYYGATPPTEGAVGMIECQLVRDILAECDKIDAKHGPDVCRPIFDILNEACPDHVAVFLNEQTDRIWGAPEEQETKS